MLCLSSFSLLTFQPHPQPFQVAWVNNISSPITKKYLAPLILSDYAESIWCDVFLTDVAHMLLTCSWQYNKDVHIGWANSYVFKFNGKPIKPKHAKCSRVQTLELKSSSKIVLKHKIQVLGKPKFEASGKLLNYMLALVTKGVSHVESNSTIDLPPKVSKLLS